MNGDPAAAFPWAASAWEREGLRLSNAARSVMFEVGDWWNDPPEGVNRVEVVRSDQWRAAGGLPHSSCWTAGSIAKRWPPLSRLKGVSFEHHRAVASLADGEALPLLEAARHQELSVSELRALVKRDKRAAKESALGATQRAASVSAVAGPLYGVIYADPPWRFDAWSIETGMDRAADNHYPTMGVDEIAHMAVPAADDCVLFLWATAPMLPEALYVTAHWGFAYRSHFVWVKNRIGTGYWCRNQHELLLIGARGDVPAPAPGEQYASVIEAAVTEHSRKPEAFAEMIEDMFPTLPAIELFARRPRLGWAVHGNEIAA